MTSVVPGPPAGGPASFPDLLADRLRAEPAAPLVTCYDDAIGERTELSATSLANWVSKTANLLVDELELDAGDTVLLRLPTHWLVPVILGGAWSAGVVVTTDSSVDHDAVVTGPEELPTWAAEAASTPVLACSLHPLALRFPEQLPPGVLDHGALWAGQGDVFVASEPAGPHTPAWRDAQRSLTQADLLTRALEVGHPAATRLLTDAHPAVDGGVPAFLAPLVSGGSLVLVRRPDEARWEERARQERATVVSRS